MPLSIKAAAGKAALLVGGLTLPMVIGMGEASAQTSTYQCSVLPKDITLIPPPPPTNCVSTQLGDKLVTYNPNYFSFTPPSALPPIVPPGSIFSPQVDISYSWIPGGFGQPRDNDFSNDSWLIEVGAANSPFVGDFGITYGFDVEIVSGLDDSTPPFDADGTNWVFDRVGLAVDANQLPVSGQRVVKAVNGITGAVTTFEFELVNVNEVPVGDAIKTLSGNYKKISIIDSITIPAGATLTSVSNAWTQRPIQTPGPVAIAGAATAFGFSRRLRNRVKAAKAS